MRVEPRMTTAEICEAITNRVETLTNLAYDARLDLDRLNRIKHTFSLKELQSKTIGFRGDIEDIMYISGQIVDLLSQIEERTQKQDGNS